MGMYTELFVKVALKEDTPESIINIIQYLVGGVELTADVGEHLLFTKPRWEFVLCSASYYHQPFTTTNFKYDDIAKQWYLCSRSDLKDYDGEIEAFFDWLSPYVETSADKTFIGYSLYEEDSEPKLYFVHE